MKLYIDDTRTAPDGWTQAFTFAEALDIIQDNTESITHIDFDYYLSEQHPAPTGLRLIQELIHLEDCEPIRVFHQPRHHYTTHSSDSHCNEQMNALLDRHFGAGDPAVKPKVSQLTRLRKNNKRR